MINELLKPIEERTDFVPKSDKHGNLKIHVSLFNTPKMTTGEHNIHSIIEITEEETPGVYSKPFSQLLYEKILTDKEINERIELIKENPFNFKAKSDEQD